MDGMASMLDMIGSWMNLVRIAIANIIKLFPRDPHRATVVWRQLLGGRPVALVLVGRWHAQCGG